VVRLADDLFPSHSQALEAEAFSFRRALQEYAELSGIIMEINDLRVLDVAGPGKPKFKVQGSRFKVEPNPLQFSPINWVGLLLPFPAGHYPLSPNHYSCPYFKEQARERPTNGYYHD
jgi:hypothetical protein